MHQNLSLQGGETHKPGYGSGKFYEHKSAHKGHKGSYHEGQGTLSRIFKLVKYNGTLSTKKLNWEKEKPNLSRTCHA